MSNKGKDTGKMDVRKSNRRNPNRVKWTAGCMCTFKYETTKMKFAKNKKWIFKQKLFLVKTTRKSYTKL